MPFVRGVAAAIAAAGVMSAVGVATAGQGQPSTYKGLEISALSVARAQNVPLVDCPPGTNTQRGNATDGEEFAVVTLAFKVTPDYKDTIVKKPVLTDASGKVFNTSVAIIDAGSKPDYQCAFPFRVPTGTKVASIAIDTVSIRLAELDKK